MFVLIYIAFRWDIISFSTYLAERFFEISIDKAGHRGAVEAFLPRLAAQIYPERPPKRRFDRVTVSDDTDSCSATVAAGQCSLTFTSSGQKTLTAFYAGDSSFFGSTSAGVSHTVDSWFTYLPSLLK